MSSKTFNITILGASGLIGHAIAVALIDEGYNVTACARKFGEAQRARLSGHTLECELIPLSDNQLLEGISQADIIVNCIGVLQGDEDTVHFKFVENLLELMADRAGFPFLVHLSVPGSATDDRTKFSQTKRLAEQVIKDSHVPHAILAPGFVIASAAYGGSALVRSLASLPFDLPTEMKQRPFQVTDIKDIEKTVAFLAREWMAGRQNWSETWDVMATTETDLGDVISGFRSMFGGTRISFQLPNWSLSIGARFGDWIAKLGWRPPIRTTALRELRRGVSGKPQPWIKATGIEPQNLMEILKSSPATVQDAWFARLFLLKALIVVILCVFWSLSGLIALFPAYEMATSILTDRGFPVWLAAAITIISSLMDIAIGFMIAWRRTLRVGLFLGIGVSIFYMIGAAILTPEMWIEPLGALVKTGPAIVLMMVALAIDRSR